MSKLMDLSLNTYLEQAKTKDPTPGGGSVAAYVGAVGAALSMMVLELSYGKKSYEALEESVKAELETRKQKLDEIAGELSHLVDEDANSFNGVLAAYKYPKTTEEEIETRNRAIEEGYKLALEVPLKAARMMSEALNLLDPFVKHGNIHAITDVGCSILFLAAGIEAALFNVTINLKSIHDEHFVSETSKEVAQLIDDAHEQRDHFLNKTYQRLGGGRV